jgi:hypothetical protein
MDQVIQIISLAGALMILSAYGASQVNRIQQTSLAYITLNLVGSAILAVIAIIGSQWGFVLLEGVWALISLWAFIRYFLRERD